MTRGEQYIGRNNGASHRCGRERLQIFIGFGPYYIYLAMDYSHARNGMQGVSQRNLVQPNLNLIDMELFVAGATLKSEFKA